MQTPQKTSFGLISNNFRNVPEEEQRTETEDNHLEALKVLSYSILSEVEALKREKTHYSNLKIDLATKVQNYEVSLIRGVLMRTGGNRQRAARLLGIKISTLHAKIKRFGITPNGRTLAERD